jgi:hypothetical protein
MRDLLLGCMGAVIFAVTVAGCQKKEEPVPAASNAPQQSTSLHII